MWCKKEWEPRRIASKVTWLVSIQGCAVPGPTSRSFQLYKDLVLQFKPEGHLLEELPLAREEFVFGLIQAFN